MKFDCIIMNPPYKRNLHLKILAEAIKHLKDDESVCVNLSPDSHMKNPSVWISWNKNNKVCDFCFSHIKTYNHINHNSANAIFNLGNAIESLHIGVYGKNSSTKLFPHHEFVKIVEKIMNSKPNLRNKFVRKEMLSCNGIKVYRYHSADNVYNSIICESGKAVEGIDFSDSKSSTNFKNSVFCWPYNLMYILGDVNPAHLPWLGDAINPRTGLKGYQSEWTDEDFYKFFNITPEEQKVIEETMAKYK